VQTALRRVRVPLTWPRGSTIGALVTQLSSLTSLPEQHVERALDQAAGSAARRHPRYSSLVHVELSGLMHHLRRALTGTSAPNTSAWSAYVTQLDHGLGELQIEMDEAAEQQDTVREPDVAPGERVRSVLRLRCRSLELLTWRFSLLTQGDDRVRRGPQELQALLQAERQLRRCEAAGQPQRELEEAVQRVRSQLTGAEAPREATAPSLRA
jgi:hypothetical protein